jgi:hypothetical protein
MAIPIGRSLGQSIGKFFTRMRNPRYVAAQATEKAADLFVLNRLGKYVYAKLHGHFHHDDGKVAHYKDADGTEYVTTQDKKYRYDAGSDSLHPAD